MKDEELNLEEIESSPTLGGKIEASSIRIGFVRMVRFNSSRIKKARVKPKASYRYMVTTGDPVLAGHRSVPDGHFTG